MILYINTSQKDKFTLGLYDNKKDRLVLKTIKSPIGTMSEKFLPELDKFLKDNNTNVEKLKSIIVFQGPGSYTSLRIGISIANALAWSLNIPIMGILAKNLKCKSQSSDSKLKSGENSIQKEILLTTKKIKNKKHFVKPVKPHYQQEIK